MNVADVMTRGVISLAPEDSMRTAAQMMLQYDLSGFPVVDKGKLVGIVTEGDFLRRAEIGTERQRPRWIEFLTDSGQLADEYAHAHGRTVGDVMTRNVITIGPDAPISDAIQLMEQHRIKRLPVVRGGAIVGILSRANLLHTFVAAVAASPTTEQILSDDAAIHKQLTAEFNRHPWARSGSINATVEHGVVNLRGVVNDERQHAALRIAAENIPGVKEVRNELVELAPRPKKP
jgi:CBS-domain-containing membrane protein